MLIIAIILVGMLAGAAAQLVFRSRKRPIDWTAAIVVGLMARQARERSRLAAGRRPRR